jgi:hypothetical protein
MGRGKWKMKNTRLDQEFKEFLGVADANPSPNINHQILAKVRADLNPSIFSVFSKLILIHALVSVFALSVCPQFGFQVFRNGMGLMHFFMQLGTYGCPMACGSFFIGLSVVAACFILKIEEIRKIKQTWVLQLGALSLLSLGFFFMMDSEIVFSFAAIWFLGALIGSVFTLEMGWFLKEKIS